MAAQIGIVKALIGTATATAADGTIRNLQIGDQVFANELITTGAGSAIELEFADGSLMDLGRNSQAILDDTIFNPEAATAVAETTDSEVDAIQAALLAGEDPTQIAEATAAGAGVEDGNEGHPPVVVDYLAPQVTPDSGFDTTGIGVVFPEIEEELQAPISPDLTPPVDYDVSVTASYVEELPFEIVLGGIPSTSISLNLDNGDNSVGYIYFTVGSDANVSIAANGSGVDPQIHLFADDGSLDLANLLASNDDSGPGLNSLINADLSAGDYVLAVSDFYFTSSEAVSGDNTDSTPSNGIYEVVIGSSTATITINEGSSSDPATAITGSHVFENDYDSLAFNAGFLYEFQVGENEIVLDNIHGTDVEDGVTTDFTITSLPMDSDANQVGLLLVDRNDDGSIEEIYGDGYSFLPAGGLEILSGDSVYYFQVAMSDFESEEQSRSEIIVQPVPVTFNYFTTDTDGLISDGAVVSIGFSVVPTPTVVLAGVEVEQVLLQEDSSESIAVSANTNDGSHLSTLVIDGFEPEVDASWLDLSGLEVNGATAVFSGGQITVTGLSGTDFNGSFSITPPADSDLDPGNLTAIVTAVSDADAGLQVVDNSPTVAVVTDAVLDQYGDVTTVAVADSSESTSGTQTISLGASMTLADTGWNNNDADSSETLSVTLTLDTTLPADAVLSSTAGTVTQVGTSNVYTITGVNIEAAVAGLQVTVAQGWDGTISGSIATHAFETVSGDFEEVVAGDGFDNVKDDTASFSVTVTPGVTPPTVVTDIEGEHLLIQEDGSGVYHVTATAGATDIISEITVANLPAGATITGNDGGSYDSGTGVYTVNGTPSQVVLTVTVYGVADSDVDLGTTTFTATAADATSPTTTTTANTTATVVVDAVLDQYGDVTTVAVADSSESTSGTQTISLGASMTLADTGWNNNDADSSETLSVTLTLDTTLPADAVLSSTAGTVTQVGTSNVYTITGVNIEAAVAGLQVTVAQGWDGTISGSIATHAFETVSGDFEEVVAGDGFDNVKDDTANFSVTVTPGSDEPIAALTVSGDGYFKEDVPNDVTIEAHTADSTDELTSMTLAGLTGWTINAADLTALAADPDVNTVTFVGGVLTITFNSGVEDFTYSALTLTAPQDTDADTAVTLTANVQDKTDNTVTNSVVVNPTLVVDAVADLTTVSITVDDNLADGDATFDVNEDGTVTVSASFGDTADASETHTVTVVVPTGFTVGGDSSADSVTVNLDGTTTLVYTVVGASLDDSFTVTNANAGGTYEFTADSMAEEFTLTGIENDFGDNIQTDSAAADAIASEITFPAGLAYSIAGGGGTGAFLYGIDLATGSTYQIGAVVVDGNDKAQFSSLTLNPIDGYLYGLADQGNLNGFVKVNTATGEAELLFQSNLLNQSTTGMSFDSLGNLYIGIDDDIYLITAGELAAEDYSGLTSSYVSFTNTGVSMDAMAYDGAGTFYFVSGSQLYTLTGTGSQTAVALPNSVGDTIDGLSFDENGNLWGADNLGTIYNIDTDTGTGTLVATISNSDVTNSGIHSLAISQVEPGTYVTFSEDGASNTHYYAYSATPIVDVLDSTDTGLGHDSDVTVSIAGHTVTVVQTDTSDPVDSVAIRVDASATINVDGFDQTDVFTRDGDPSIVNIMNAEGGTIQTGEADDVIDITAATADVSDAPTGETFTIATDGGDDAITLDDLIDSTYIIQAGEALDASGNLTPDLTDIDTINIDGSIDLGTGPLDLSNVEIINITGTGNNVLTLSAADVLDASDGSNTLIIQGDVGDSLVSAEQWTPGDVGVTGLDGGIYNVYSYDDGSGLATILVDQNINITQQLTD
ncbi:MAG: retention module-containing protein [Gammaproteobacteria bacterium]|nr:retention module-containing protein [Gammaproteobacteria bacterium]